MTTVLGIHSAGHDTGICLWEDGVLRFAMETERVTRRRHDHDVAAILPLLDRIPGFDPAGIDLVAASTVFRHSLMGIPDHRDVERRIADRDLHVETTCTLLGRTVPCVVVAHEASHAALAVHQAGYAAPLSVLVNEGRGSFSRNSLFFHDGDRLVLDAADALPWYGSGFGWSAIGYLLGFGKGPSVAGKVMALGGFAEATDAARNAILDIDPGLTLLGAAGQAEQGASLVRAMGLDGTILPAARLVAGLQALFSDAVLDLLRRHVARRAAVGVALGGGCALNIVTNSVLRSALGLPIHVPAACNDSGQALGAAIYAQNFLCGLRPRPFPVYANGTGEEPDRIRATLLAAGLPAVPYDEEIVARQLATGAVVAFHHGPAELGPRALGNRSLLANPALPGMKSRLSVGIKKREWFRPLAPVVREETFRSLYPDADPSPHMLFNFDGRRLAAPEAIHVDGTARIQTVCAAANPRLHGLLGAFERMSGVKALINTSLNAGGLPIAQTVRDTLDDFLSCDVDLFVFGDQMVQRSSLARRTA